MFIIFDQKCFCSILIVVLNLSMSLEIGISWFCYTSGGSKTSEIFCVDKVTHTKLLIYMIIVRMTGSAV